MISDLEIRRRIFHLVSGVVIIGMIFLNIIDAVVVLILLSLLIVLGVIVKRFKVPFAYWFFKKFDRPEDFKKLPGKGSVFYLIGVVSALLLFPRDIAMAGIIIMALGDPIAAIVGQYGSIESPFDKKKYIEGSIAGALAAFVGALLFVSPLEAGLASVAAMIAEGISLKIGTNQLDDNIIMPLAAGSVIWIVRII